MKTYEVIKKGGFKGSPDGAVTLNFTEGSTVTRVDLGDSLAETALGEKWIKEIKVARESKTSENGETNGT